jgi:NADH dehydrogenase FAD-containing subunit
LCTGSTYGAPIKDVHADTYEERKSGLEIEKEAIKRAQSVLVVGGGVVGVEMIGELCDLNAKTINSAVNDPSIKGKKIGLVFGGPTIMPHFPIKAQQIAT